MYKCCSKGLGRKILLVAATKSPEKCKNEDINCIYFEARINASLHIPRERVNVAVAFDVNVDPDRDECRLGGWKLCNATKVIR